MAVTTIDERAALVAVDLQNGVVGLPSAPHATADVVAAAFAGLILVMTTCSRRSAATAASIDSASRSPLTVCPVRVRPLYANVAIWFVPQLPPCPPYRMAPTGRGAPGLVSPAPATTPTPRFIISFSSSLSYYAPSSVSREIILLW